MKRAAMAMLCLALVGSVEAGGKISFPLSNAEAVQFCRAFGQLVGRYQGYLAAGETKAAAARHFDTLFDNVNSAMAKVLLTDYLTVASTLGLEDGKSPALHRVVAQAVCLEFNKGISAVALTMEEERKQCEKEKRGIAGGWDM